MKHTMLAVLGAVLAFSASYAHADSMNQISFTGNSTISSNGDVTFGQESATNGNALVGGTSTGIFAPFLPATTNPLAANTIVNFMDFNANTVPPLPTGIHLFDAVAPDGERLDFYINSQNFNNSQTSPTDSGTGYYAFTMPPSTSCGDCGPVTNMVQNGVFTLTSQGTEGTNVTFSDTNSITPEPSSLLLLGTGLVSAAGMLAHRRRLMA